MNVSSTHVSHVEFDHFILNIRDITPGNNFCLLSKKLIMGLRVSVEIEHLLREPLRAFESLHSKCWRPPNKIPERILCQIIYLSIFRGLIN